MYVLFVCLFVCVRAPEKQQLNEKQSHDHSCVCVCVSFVLRADNEAAGECAEAAAEP